MTTQTWKGGIPIFKKKETKSNTKKKLSVLVIKNKKIIIKKEFILWTIKYLTYKSEEWIIFLDFKKTKNKKVFISKQNHKEKKELIWVKKTKNKI